MAKAEKKKRQSKVPENETAEQRTRRLAIFRVSRAVKDISSVRSLAGASYTLTEEQKVEILAALKNAVSVLSKTFAGEKEAESGFQLSK